LSKKDRAISQMTTNNLRRSPSIVHVFSAPSAQDSWRENLSMTRIICNLTFLYLKMKIQNFMTCMRQNSVN